MGSKLDNNTSSSESNQIDLQEPRKFSLERCVSSLVHSCYCSDVSCDILGCLNMKQVINHSKLCRRKNDNNCYICKQFIALVYYHAKACQAATCAVLFCLNIRHKIRKQKLIQIKEQALKTNATMQNQGMPYTIASQSSASSLLSSAPSFPTLECPTQPGCDMKPPTMSQDETPMETNQGQTVGLGMPQKSQFVESSNLSTSNRNTITKSERPVGIATRLNISSESSDLGSQSIIASQPSAPQDPTQPGIDINPTTMPQGMNPIETVQEEISTYEMPQGMNPIETVHEEISTYEMPQFYASVPVFATVPLTMPQDMNLIQTVQEVISTYEMPQFYASVPVFATVPIYDGTNLPFFTNPTFQG